MSQSKSNGRSKKRAFVAREPRTTTVPAPAPAALSRCRENAAVLPGDAPAEGAGTLRSPWLWMTLAVMMLAASGAVRRWQDHRFGTVSQAATTPPFPLKTLPTELGPWHLVEGSEHSLDPRIARIAGSTDHVVRTYVNELTGVHVSALILYGNGEAVAGHSPEVCYPSAGFKRVDGPTQHEVATAQGKALFRSLLFVKEGAESGPREEVFYSFRHEGSWFVDPEKYWKVFRHRPSLYKVQTQRRVVAGEHLEKDNPSEDFLALLVDALERQLAPGGASSPPRAAAPTTTPSR